MNRFDGKYYWIDEPLAFQKTSIGESFPRASITLYDTIISLMPEPEHNQFIKTFPIHVADNILELYRESNNQGEFKIIKTGQGKQSRYEVIYIPETAKVEVITTRIIINPIMELDVNE